LTVGPIAYPARNLAAHCAGVGVYFAPAGFEGVLQGGIPMFISACRRFAQRSIPFLIFLVVVSTAVVAQKVSTIAGALVGDGGPASQADLNEPLGVAVDPTGNIYIADYGNFALRKIDTEGTITTLATEVFLNSLVTDPSGNIYASDDAFCVVWKFTPSGQASIVAGMEYNCGYNSDNIPATQAELSFPEGLAFDGAGNLYISDMGNSRVRMVDLQGIIHTVAGDGNPGFSGDGGLAIDAMINGNQGIGIDKNNNLYIADAYNTRIRVVNSSGIISTYAGTYGAGYNGNNLPASETDMEPFPLAVNSSGVVVYGDVSTYLVRAVH